MKKHFIKIGYGALLGLISAVVVWSAANFFATEILTQYEWRTYDWRIKKQIEDA